MIELLVGQTGWEVWVVAGDLIHRIAHAPLYEHWFTRYTLAVLLVLVIAANAVLVLGSRTEAADAPETVASIRHQWTVKGAKTRVNELLSRESRQRLQLSS